MPQHIHLLELNETMLQHLSKSTEPINDSNNISYVQESRKFLSAHNGFYNTEIVISTLNESKEKIYFKFLEVSYLDNQVTYTKPFEVFKSEEVKTRVSYSNYIDDDAEF